MSSSKWQDVAWRILLGQVLSFCVSLTGLFSSLLAQQKTSVALLQSSCSYLLIFTVVAPVHHHYCSRRAVQERRDAKPWYRHGIAGTFSSMFPLWRYAVLGVFDVGASFFAIAAYQKTDITSAQLLDDATIVTVMVLGYFFLQRRYNVRHYLGVALAVGGMIGLVFADAADKSRDSTKTAPDPVLGDTMMLIAATLYGFTNTACECLLKSERVVVPPWMRRCGFGGDGEITSAAVASADELEQQQHQSSTSSNEHAPLHPLPSHDDQVQEKAAQQWGSMSDVLASADKIAEYVVFLTFFGFLLSFLLMLATSISDIKEAADNHWTWHSTLFQLAFCCSMVATYVGLPVVLHLTTATFTVLSLLTADFYSVLLNYVTSGVAPTGLYWGMAAVILAGTVVFDTADKPVPCAGGEKNALDDVAVEAS